jgi:hypothetical protein
MFQDIKLVDRLNDIELAERPRNVKKMNRPKPILDVQPCFDENIDELKNLE